VVTSAQHHIIRRQILEVAVAGAESDGLALQRRLADLCQGWLASALETALEDSVPGDEHWIIDRLEVDVGTIALDTFERDLVETVIQAIARRLGEGSPGVPLDGIAVGVRPVAPWPTKMPPPEAVPLGSSGPIQRRTDAQSVQGAFLHFLETGLLPWWFHLPAGKGLEDVVLAFLQTARQAAHLDRALMDTIALTGARTRLVRQFSEDFLRTLLAGLSTEGVPAMQEILAEMTRHNVTPEMSGPFSEQLWRAAFTAVAFGRRLTVQNIAGELMNALLAGGGWPEYRLLERIADLWHGTQSRTREIEERTSHNRPQSADMRAKERRPHELTQSRDTQAEERIPPGKGAIAAKRDEPASRMDLQEGVYVDCAGLVLLHPFLPRLFEALCITKDDKLVQPNRALCLLHFLATGERRAPEYELLLPKLLCNVPLAEPAEAPIALTVAEEEEAVALLEAAIGHWEAVGDTSIDGLRGTFLVRPGKLFQRSNGDDVLQVEPRSFDILLDRLPWGIGMVQLPWMEKILWVEWRF
jgi:hypothetical protein